MSKKTHHKKRAGGVAQGVGPEFKLQNCQKKKKRENSLSEVAHTYNPRYLGGGD
jgi:hypothetical protein